MDKSTLRSLVVKQLASPEFQDYIEESSLTWAKPPTLKSEMLHIQFGALDEIGEVYSCFKKAIRKASDKTEISFDDIDKVNFEEEIGDLMYYVARWMTMAALNEDEPVYCNNRQERVLSGFLENKFNSPRQLLLEAMWFHYQIYGESPEELFPRICIANLQKLRARFPNGYDNKLDTNRDLATERNKLEQNLNG